MAGNMLSNVSTIALSAGAVALFQCATLVIGGHIAKETLEPFYSTFPHWWQRMLIVLLPLPGFGNLLAASAYTNPYVAGASILVFTAWATLASSAYIGSAKIDPTNVGLAAAISVLAIWFAVRLHQ